MSWKFSSDQENFVPSQVHCRAEPERLEDALRRCELDENTTNQLAAMLRDKGATKASDLRHLEEKDLTKLGSLKEFDKRKVMEEVINQQQKFTDEKQLETEDEKNENEKDPFKILEKAHEVKFINDQVKMHHETKVQEINLAVQQKMLEQKVHEHNITALQLNAQVDKQNHEHEEKMKKMDLEKMAAQMEQLRLEEAAKRNVLEREQARLMSSFDAVVSQSNSSGHKFFMAAVSFAVGIVFIGSWKIESWLSLCVFVLIGLIVLCVSGVVYWINARNVTNFTSTNMYGRHQQIITYNPADERK